MTMDTRYHERTARRAYGSFVRAVEDGRHLDAVQFATEALTLREVGYGTSLPAGSVTEMVEALDRLTAGDGTTIWAEVVA